MTQVSTQIATEQERQKLVESVLRSSKSKASESNPVESMLLEWFMLGELTLDQTLSFIEAAQQQ